MKKLIIFDYDGVIVNSFPTVHNVYQEICKKIKKKCPNSLEKFKKIYGGNSSECHRNLEFSDADILFGNKMHREVILKKDIPIIPGIIEAIEELSKDYNMVVISSALEEVVKKNLNKFKISKYFKEIIGEKEVGIRRLQKSEAIKLTVKKYSTPENTISIGDRNVDFIEGTVAGLKNILLVDYGWGYNKKLIPEYNQKFEIKAPSELIKVIENIFKVKK